ncbi:hypothetical protein [Spirosoma sp.]|uniref:hypothetical protein n=1 Tax=Spirosoma sp. TaxID=1899569 RepID=UPI00261B4D8D|nr:hypothetical protein [Spirosoma sp.]MCX6215361.1 hypothetical protein [Spirosoma sp.]
MRSTFITLVLLALLSNAKGQGINWLNHTWKYSRLVLASSTDSLDLYNADSVSNIYNLRAINLQFKRNNLYIGTDIVNLPKSGTWSLYNDQYLVIDEDTSQLLTSSYKELKIKNSLHYTNDDLDITGELITILYKVAPEVNYCESVKSGEWADPAIWSCGHLPTLNDVVLINNSHTISISIPSAQAQRIIYYGGIIKFSSSDSKVFIKEID